MSVAGAAPNACRIDDEVTSDVVQWIARVKRRDVLVVSLALDLSADMRHHCVQTQLIQINAAFVIA
jgi:hypothetical protein